MVRRIASVLLSAFLLMSVVNGCQSKPRAAASAWDLRRDKLLEELWWRYPEIASTAGLTSYILRFDVPDEESRKARLKFLNYFLGELAAIDKAQLKPQDAMDYELLRNFAQSMIWDLQTFKSYQWDPSIYNMGPSLGAILENGKLSEKEKMQALAQRLSVAPAYYQAALKNIKVPTREHTELAIDQSEGFVTYLEGEVQSRIAKTDVWTGAEKDALQLSRATAVKAVQGYVAHLKALKTRLEKAQGFRSFRIGRTLYAQKFKYDLQSRLSAEQMYLKAVKAKQDIHKEMLARAKTLWPKYFGKKAPPASPTALIKKVLDKLADNHIQPVQFVATVEQQLPQLSRFVEQKQLLTMDPSKPLKVRETPLYARGFAGASVDAPGPFDAGRETYYNVTPLDGMSPEKQQNYLREYNNYTLQILNIHEAIPGHYVQLVYSAKSPSVVKSIFGSNAMIEGWAVYGERMMMEEGYGNNEPELWMMYDKWRLRIVCNVILDYSLHNLNMSKERALSLLKDEAFQEETQIEEKWKRATYSQVQLASYFTGFSEIYELREEMKKQLGDKFSLKAFNEQFLSYGSAPVRLIRDEMLRPFVAQAGAAPAKGSQP